MSPETSLNIMKTLNGNTRVGIAQAENLLADAPNKSEIKEKSFHSKSEILEYANACYATGKIKNLKKFIRHLQTGKQDRSINFYLELANYYTWIIDFRNRLFFNKKVEKQS